MSAVLAAFVSVALVLARGPRGRGVVGIGIGIATPRAVGTRAGLAARWMRRRMRGDGARGGGAYGGGLEKDLIAVVTEVISALRSGADPGHAWERALGHPVGADGTPDLEDLAGLLGDHTDGAREQVAAVIVAGRLAAVLGAPLAQVLERTTAGLVRSAEAEADRRAALAGPRATARVLTWLPVLAVGLGIAVGADPVGVLLGGGIGSLALASGTALVLIGRAWIARLVRAAARAGRAG